MFRIKRYLSALLCVMTAWLMTSCLDETFGDFRYGDGDADLRATVEFENLTPALETRTPGNAIGSVFNLQMVIYRVEDGKTTLHEIVDCNSLPDYKYTGLGNITEPDDAEKTGNGNNDGVFGSTGERTDHADFSFGSLRYGRYKIYAAANVPKLSKEDCETEEKLKEISFTWDEKNIAGNNAMFGYFTRSDDQSSSGFDAPIILVNSRNMDIHAWIKRLVSKVTVAFDPSELKEAVTVYIKSVTIHDIPKTCPLGEENHPDKASDLIKTGESIKYYTDATADDYTKWGIILQKGTGKKGSVNHANSDPSLFFFENMQGNYQGQKAYLKEQIPDETGTSIDDPTYNTDGSIKNDYKDRVEYGTYIEVIAYYVSKNTEKMSSGNIKYRFMLGKDITYDYNAQRNYHYKLTLKLRGFANEADWHITYEEPDPIIYAESYNASYLYGQEHGLPVRILTGDGLTDQYYVRAEIIENGWYPTVYGTTNSTTPSQTVGAYNNLNGFAWNELAKNTLYKGKNYVGFLSLRKPEEGELFPNIRYGEATNAALDNYYETKALGYGAYSLEVNEDGQASREVGHWNTTNNKYIETKPSGADNTTYTVRKDADGSISLRIPMYTRQRALATSTDFSGNNPFWAYTRTSVVRLTLWTKAGKQIAFKDMKDPKKEVMYLDLPVNQVRRIENPTAIYRKSKSTEPFTVKLMYLESALSTEYKLVESDGPWRASIMCDPDGLVQLSKDGKIVTNSTADKYIEGSTGSKIEFTYTPRSEIGDNETRCAIIKVEYHDYNCNHYIYVRQGYDKGVKLGNANWSCYQVYATGQNSTSYAPQNLTSVNVMVTQNPLSIGSMLKRCQYNYSVREANLANDAVYGWMKNIEKKDVSVAYLKGNTAATKDTSYSAFGGYGWLSYNADNTSKPTSGTSIIPNSTPASGDRRFTNAWADTWTTVGYKPNQKLTVPTAAQFKSMMDNCDFAYGIAYADGAKEPSLNRDDATGFRDDNNDNCGGNGSPKGVRVCIAYNKTNGNNILFPLGSLSQGRRARKTNTTSSPLSGQTSLTTMPDPGAGTLSYTAIRALLYGNGNLYRPLTYNVYRSPGAIYWMKQPQLTASGWPDYASWDINYYNSRFAPYDYGSLGNWKQTNETTGAGTADYTTTVIERDPAGNAIRWRFTWPGCTNANVSDALPIKLVYKN